MPRLTVVAGPNGSGKSTLIALLMERQGLPGEYLNADDIARELGRPSEEVARRAQEIVRERRTAALSEGRDHAFETVMSHRSHIDYMVEAGRKGFAVHLQFVATDDPTVNLLRVANRVLHGGHDVPADRIVARYHRCLANLPAAIGAADRSDIFDNSRKAAPMTLLATIEKRPNSHFLYHQPQEVVPDPGTMAIWWLDMLLAIKPDDPFSDGRITVP